VTRSSTTWPRAVLAVLVGVLVCCAVIASNFALRYWGAVEVFTTEDWAALLPDLRGWLIDYILGLSFGVGLWAVQRGERLGGVWRAAGIGALAMFVAPQINAIFYMLTIGIPINWSLTLGSMLSRAPLPLVVGVVVGVIMWRIAYGGASRLVEAETSRGTA
jgi:hypothetical protein